MAPSVAIIGGGVSGIAAARACLSESLSVTLFEKRPCLGGMWSQQDTPVFQHLTSNTAVFETGYADTPVIRTTPHPHLSDNDSLCFHQSEMFEYLQHTARTSGVDKCAIFNATVTSISRSKRNQTSGNHYSYIVRYDTPLETNQSKTFDKLIMATGRFHTPFTPSPTQIPGLDTTKLPLMHVSRYNHPTQYTSKRVLIIGGAVSACEAAGDMAAAPEDERPSHITITTRRPRYLITKQRNGKLFASNISCRSHNLRRLAGRFGAAEANETFMKDVPAFSINTDYGVPAAVGDIMSSSGSNFIPVNQKILDASKQGDMLTWKIGGVKQILEHSVLFNDGSECEYDAILLATGYSLDLAPLDKELQNIVNPDVSIPKHCNMYDFTLHPELPGFAMIGLFVQRASYIASLDNQARWVAGVFSRAIAGVSDEHMLTGIERVKKAPSQAYLGIAFETVDLFARHGGFQVDLTQYPQYAKMLLFGPLVPAQFRVFGYGKADNAVIEFEKQMLATGYEVGDCTITQQQMDELLAVAEALKGKETYVKGLEEAIGYLQVG